MNRIEQIFQRTPHPAAFARDYFGYVCELCNRLDGEQIEALLTTLLHAREQQSRIFCIGNGGSAATASHFANDLAIGFRSHNKPLRAISLCDNPAIITAISNDFGYEHVFVRQLEHQMTTGDVVIAISASGHSQNILQAVAYAKQRGGITVGLTGFDGGPLRQMVDINIHVPSHQGEYGPVEDIHIMLNHLVGNYLRLKIQAEPPIATTPRDLLQAQP